jgi:hypothetical protein
LSGTHDFNGGTDAVITLTQPAGVRPMRSDPAAADTGADLLRMMEVSRHKRAETVRGYVRRANLFRGHAGAGFL